MTHGCLDRHFDFPMAFSAEELMKLERIGPKYAARIIEFRDKMVPIFVRPLPGDDYWDFIRELADTVGIPVDVYTDTDDAVFVKKILERGEVIYET